MNVRHYLHILCKYSFMEIYCYAVWKVRHKIAMLWLKYVDKVRMTYRHSFCPKGLTQLFPYGTPEMMDILESYRDVILSIAAEYIAHRFDLLGSGWIQVSYGMECRGLGGYRYHAGGEPRVGAIRTFSLINKSNQQEAERIGSLLDKTYVPIDWHLDFKSGYRWQSAVWYKNVTFGQRPGVDIKVPWELARMQHLPMLAWAFGLTVRSGDVGVSKVYLDEFQNQILDFLAANPPRYGVNWCSTMDVAIRLVNWLVAFDLFRSLGAVFNNGFLEVFERSIYEHGSHCFQNLEFSLTGRNNHYLANIACLFITAAYLPEDNEVNKWFEFAKNEIINEMEYQFNAEGTNFEASTSYHCLSTEMLLYCCIYSLALTGSKQVVFPDWFWERVERALEFVQDIRKPNGDIPQFGDNDSGRFVKLWPCYSKRTCSETIKIYANLDGYSSEQPHQTYWDENNLNHDHLLGLGALLFSRGDMGFMAETPEVGLVRNLLGGKGVDSYHNKTSRQDFKRFTAGVTGEGLAERWYYYQEANHNVSYTIKVSQTSLKSQPRSLAYPEFGIYIYKSPDIYLAIRCGGIGRCGSGGHAHNDQLTIELSVNSIDIIRDPGSYLYTPLPKERNRFRSTQAHFTPQLRGMEQNSWEEGIAGLFTLSHRSNAQCLAFGSEGFAGVHYGFGRPVYRIIRFIQDGLVITDFGGNSIPQEYCWKYFSPGYGRLIKG
ncbi:MAG: Heparinase family protein [Firmicutes bacterium]|nr:Heparinase family protein [Bacillota bacterium]